MNVVVNKVTWLEILCNGIGVTVCVPSTGSGSKRDLDLTTYRFSQNKTYYDNKKKEVAHTHTRKCTVDSGCV